MNIAAVLPLYLSNDILLDFTKQTVESIKSEEHSIMLYFIVNFAKPEFYPKKESFDFYHSIKDVKIIDNPKGNEVGAAWNLGIKTALADGNDYVMVLNNDLVLHEKCVDNLVWFAQDYPEFLLWTAAEHLDLKTLKDIKLTDEFSEHPHFSYFMVNQKTVDTVGWFDENLKMAYHEDSDMHYRVLLSGNKAGKIESAKFYHYGSRTIHTDDELFDKNKRSYEDNRSYIKLKWGIDTHDKVYVPPEKMLEEGYKYPFNNQSKNWRDW